MEISYSTISFDLATNVRDEPLVAMLHISFSWTNKYHDHKVRIFTIEQYILCLMRFDTVLYTFKVERNTDTDVYSDQRNLVPHAK